MTSLQLGVGNLGTLHASIADSQLGTITSPHGAGYICTMSQLSEVRKTPATGLWIEPDNIGWTHKFAIAGI